MGQSSVGLAVQVWDTNTPKDAQKPAYTLHQVLDPAALSWDVVTLSGRAYRRAWWRFSFADAQAPLIPATGMSAAQFLVGIKWDRSTEPSIGYSNFNRPCDRNWTDLSGAGAWTLNSAQGSAIMCNWPMMRVNTEVLTTVTTTTTVPVTHQSTVLVERDVCDPTKAPAADGGR